MLGEFLIEAVTQILAELGIRAFSRIFKPKLNPWLYVADYILLGVMLGCVSLFIFPAHLIHSKPLRLVNLVITPMAAGLCMAGWKAWQVRRGYSALRIDSFVYGFFFALSVSMIRLGFAN